MVPNIYNRDSSINTFDRASYQNSNMMGAGMKGFSIHRVGSILRVDDDFLEV